MNIFFSYIFFLYNISQGKLCGENIEDEKNVYTYYGRNKKKKRTCKGDGRKKTSSKRQISDVDNEKRHEEIYLLLIVASAEFRRTL